jgi:hypothetical protein
VLFSVRFFRSKLDVQRWTFDVRGRSPASPGTFDIAKGVRGREAGELRFSSGRSSKPAGTEARALAPRQCSLAVACGEKRVSRFERVEGNR